MEQKMGKIRAKRAKQNEGEKNIILAGTFS